MPTTEISDNGHFGDEGTGKMYSTVQIETVRVILRNTWCFMIRKLIVRKRMSGRRLVDKEKQKNSGLTDI